MITETENKIYNLLIRFIVVIHNDKIQISNSNNFDEVLKVVVANNPNLKQSFWMSPMGIDNLWLACVCDFCLQLDACFC